VLWNGTFLIEYVKILKNLPTILTLSHVPVVVRARWESLENHIFGQLYQTTYYKDGRPGTLLHGVSWHFIFLGSLIHLQGLHANILMEEGEGRRRGPMFIHPNTHPIMTQFFGGSNLTFP
jgi:hypothetical protein